jgi:type VI secretion system protein ImpH
LEQDLDVHVLLRPVPRKAACFAGGAGAARLGWTSWLGAGRAASATTEANATATPTALKPLAPARFTLRMPPSAAAWRPSNA